MVNKIIRSKFFRYIILSFIIILSISFIYFDVNLIRDFFYNIVDSLDENRFFILLLIFLLFSLRSISIVIPVLPGTIFSVAAGFQFGISHGLAIIFFADFISCSISFLLARKLGRNYISHLLGQRQMQKVESISKNHLEKNYFLMTALLMSGFFDFVCYAIGLTKIKWKRFMPALVFSIIISDLPFVASGFRKKNYRYWFKKLLRKNIKW